MERIYFTKHRGKTILIEDFTGVKPGMEYTSLLAQAQQIIAAQPPKSVLAVFDATGAHYNAEMLAAMKEFTKANTPYIQRAVVVGIHGLLQVALSAVARFAGREFLTAATRAEAMDQVVG